MSAHARFYLHSAINADKSAAAGRKVYEDRLMIEIRTSKNSSFSRPVEESDKYEFPEAWAAYVRDNPAGIDGTPLRCLPSTTSSLLIMLDEREIRSIEALAEATDIADIEGALRLQKQARAYLAAMADDEPAEAPKRGRKPKATNEEQSEVIAA